ncbi:MAG: hypothetical protein NTZ26_12280, partial [Candidatus Aminicenantes bacterium]|nr:hypothetical protein [Candidatus Aminicenantes bacterium]
MQAQVDAHAEFRPRGDCRSNVPTRTAKRCRRRAEKRKEGVKNPRRRDEYRDAGHTEWNEIYFF